MRNPLLNDLPNPIKGKIGWPWTAERTQVPATMDDDCPWPRLSIVTPSYNQGAFLEETIRSVLLQAYPNLEYIIMDGGSKDDSLAIIRKYKPWLSYLHIGPDGGQSAAIAEGFRHASGDILAWINSDDRFMPGTLMRVARFFSKHPRVMFGNGDVNCININGDYMLRYFSVSPNKFLTANLGIHGWPQQGCFWRRSAYESVGGMDGSLRFCMDRDLFIRLTAFGGSCRIPGPSLGDFRTHEEAKSSTLLDIGECESMALIAKYGNRALGRHRWLLHFLWQLWCLPTFMRSRTIRWFNWEW